MNKVIEENGILLLEDDGSYYLQYDAGAHMIKNKRIEITNEEADICRLSPETMYEIILKYQDGGIYGEDV